MEPRCSSNAPRRRYYIVDATRAGMTGFQEASVPVALLVASAVAAVTIACAVTILARGWRLKP
jgi:hypothetical protein